MNTTSKPENEVELCRAGGKHGGHHNYGGYHVTGAIYRETGELITVATNCFYCGREFTAMVPRGDDEKEKSDGYV